MANTVVTNTPTVLIADDYPDVLVALRLLLKGEGFQLETVSSPERLLEALGRRSFDLVLMDLNYTRDTTSGAEGLNLLERIRLIDQATPIVAMTAWGSIELAVEAMQRGVCDFILKPWDNVRLLQTLRTHLEAGRARRREHQLQAQRQAEQVRELAAALEIQQSLLPHTILPLRGCELATAWQPVRAVSGDFFNVLHFNETTSAICIGDVSGKGMPAALVMSNTQALTKAFAEIHCQPRDLCAQINRALCSQLSSGRFVTFFYAHFDSDRRTLCYSNAGHNPPLVLKSDGECLPLAMGGTVLGVFKEQAFEQAEVSLASGDRVLLYTDGITEAVNETGEEFGEDRLLGLLRSHRHLSADALQQTIMAAVTEFCGGNFQDDATLLVLAIG